MPEDVERMVKKLEKHEDDIESPWGLATYLKQKGYKMPAAEKYKLPTPKEEEELDQYEKKLSDKVQGKAEYDPTKGGKILAPKTAEEDIKGPTAPVGEIHLPTEREEHDLKHFRKQLTGKMKGLGVPKKAEESTLTPHYKPPKPKEPEHKLSPKDEIESFLHLHQKACEECDPLVFPDEYKMGMKEEQEHADVTGSDKEAIKKIVLAHLAEDPHYYTKLGTVMKAGERPAGPIDVSKGAPPGFEKKKDWGIPKKAEEASPKEQMKSTPGYIKQQQKEIERIRVPKKAEEEIGLIDKIKGTIKDITTKSPQKESLPPLTKSMVNKMQIRARRPSRAGEDKDLSNDSLNDLYSFMMWLIDNGHTPDKDKNFAKLINQYDVEKFSSEQEKQSDSDKLGEMEKPARFKAEPKDGV